MQQTAFSNWFNNYQQQAIAQKQRRLIVLAGEYDWSISLLKGIGFQSQYKVESSSTDKVNAIAEPIWHVYSDSPYFLEREQYDEQSNKLSKPKSSINRQSYRQQLGTESQYVVFADSQFNIDALAALSGTLIAGGVLFILWPEAVKKSVLIEKILFLQRFFKQVLCYPSHTVIEQNQTVQYGTIQYETNSEISVNPLVENSNKKTPLFCATDEQDLAVQALVKVATGHRNRPLVLTADRGRGKSSALAIACSELLNRKGKDSLKTTALPKQHVIITAPHVKSLGIFFKQLKTCLPDAEHFSSKVVHENGIVEFLPIDHILKNKPSASLVLVDEAAALPIYLLTQLLAQYHRLTFASTVHGYEGAGRGFTLKFQSYIEAKYPQWRKLHLNQPIRWANNDPLEDFIFDVCLLNANLPTLSSTAPLANPSTTLPAILQVKSEVLTAQQLLLDEALLKQVFAVLVTAHYQTKPSDLQLLLDNNNIHIVCVFLQEKRQEKQQNKSVIAVALLMAEGQSDKNDIVAVKQSKRRLRNQFIPQSLLTHCGVEQAFEYNYFRIMRIAVHPQCQQQGIGSFLLKDIEDYAVTQNVAIIGASFGANKPLLSFWFNAEYKLARLGFNQDAASGEHSALVIKSLVNTENISGKGHKANTVNNSKSLLCDVEQQFYRTFVYLLADEYLSLADDLMALILHRYPHKFLPDLTDFDWQIIRSFANKERLYSSCAYSLHLWLLHQLASQSISGVNVSAVNMDDINIYAIISRLLKKNSVASVCEKYQFTGKKAFESQLVNFVKQRLS